MPQVKKEHTNWRDQALSNRHRLWGWDCPAVDIDFLMIEYNRALPVTLVEYKNEHAAPQYANHASYKALSTLATNSNIPFLGVRYKDDFSQFIATPLNEFAKNITNNKRLALTEIEYVKFLYKLRGMEIPSDLEDTLG